MVNLLIVDDEAEALDYLGDIAGEITEYELKVYPASSGEEALKILRAVRVDVLLSDIKMPGMTGLELLKHARRETTRCKFILLTGYRDFDMVYEAIQAGDARYLLKTEPESAIQRAIVDSIRELEEETRGAAFEPMPKLNTPRADRVMEKIREYIVSHLSEELTLARLAELVHFNQSYLSRLFKQEMGMNVSQYILERRIEEAKKLLSCTPLRVNEIARRVGYQSPHSFSRVFRHVTGVSPQDFRI